jgi:hypothetical protein
MRLSSRSVYRIIMGFLTSDMKFLNIKYGYVVSGPRPEGTNVPNDGHLCTNDPADPL